MKCSVATGQPEPAEEQVHYHLHGDPHRRASSLSDIILGGQDGLALVGYAVGVLLKVPTPP